MQTVFPARFADAEMRGHIWIRRRIPGLGVDPVEDPDIPVAARGKDAFHAGSELGSLSLTRVGRTYRRQVVALGQARLEKAEAAVELPRVNREHAPGKTERRHDLRAEQSLIGQVVDCEHDACATKPRIAAGIRPDQRGRQASLPVVRVNDVGRPAVLHVLFGEVQRRSRKQPEALGVVAEVTAGVAVVAVAVEERGHIDHHHAPSRRDGGHVERDVVRPGAEPDGPRDRGAVWHEARAIPRKHDGHVVTQPIECERQRADDIRQPTRLGPWRHFGGHHEHAQAGRTTSQSRRGVRPTDWSA